MSRPRLFLCSGATLDDKTLKKGRHVVSLDTIDSGGNTHLLIDNITSAFERLLAPRIIDLLEIAAYVFTGDCEAPRSGVWLHEESVEPWRRDLKFCVPLRDLDFWRNTETKSALESAINYMTGDVVSFEFCKPVKERTIQSYLGMTRVDESPFYGIERVTMFSGGLDSLAGAAEAASRGDKLVLVSHRPVNKINSRQTSLVAALRERFNVPILHVPVLVNKSKMDSETSQRSRVFLFSALGAAVASVLSARGIRFYENGVISLNRPLADEVQMARASRTTHPETIHKVQAFLRLVLDDLSFTVDNPYLFKTKTEVTAVLESVGTEVLLGKSCSCIQTMFQTNTGPHCGMCGQCIDRRIAVIAAGLDSREPRDGYRRHVFLAPREIDPKRPYDHNIAVHYARYSREIQRMTPDEIAAEYGVELSRAIRRLPDQGGAIEQFISMQKRHADSVVEVVTREIENNAGDFAKGQVDSTSLLAMIMGNRLNSIQPSGDVADIDTDDCGVDDDNERAEFIYSPDYSSVRIRGRLIPLNDNQALVIKCLHEAFQNETPWISWTHLRDVVLKETGFERIQDVFKNPADFRDLIVASTKPQGRYRLNI